MFPCQVTHLDQANTTAGSLLLVQIVHLWTRRLRWASTYPTSSAQSKSKRSRPLIRLHEFEPEDLKFEPAGKGGGELDADGLPHGRGLLRIAVTEDSVETCVGSKCEHAIYK